MPRFPVRVSSAVALLLAVIAAVPVGCAARVDDDVVSARPRLVVLLVIDGLPQRQVDEFLASPARGGLRRLLDGGAWFANAHYGHAVTETAPGHATMLTGAYPHRTGIIGNAWRNRVTGAIENNVGDRSAPYIGATRAREGASPRNLQAESVGDVLRRSEARSKVIGIGGKDRSSILLAGHKGTAYVYQRETGEFASTTYYMREHPEWAVRFHARKLASSFFGKAWVALPESAPSATTIDEGLWLAKDASLPRTLGAGQDAPGPRFFGALVGTPQGDELTLAFARAAIAGEGLGKDDAPDLLSISLSAHDYVNHGYSAESRLSRDHLAHVDRLLESFLADLDTEVGRDNYLVVMTADHGFMPAPEYLQSLGHEAGRVSWNEVETRLNAALAPRFGAGQWAMTISAQAVVLNRELIAARKVDAAAITDAARAILAAEPRIDAAFTRAQIESGSRGGAPHFDAVRKSWYSERSGDIAIVLKPHWMFAGPTTVASHGSPHAYDTHVPLLVYGPRWVKPARHEGRVEIVDIAPTLARLLGIAAPSSSEGKPLPLERR